MASLPPQPTLSQIGTTQTAGVRNKGGNFIGQLHISVVPHYPSRKAFKAHLYKHLLKGLQMTGRKSECTSKSPWFKIGILLKIPMTVMTDYSKVLSTAISSMCQDVFFVV